MNINCIVYVFNSVKQCTTTACDAICTNLVNEFNNLFDIRIAFGGNSERYGAVPGGSLDEWFLKEDVVSLVLTSYLDAVQDGTFFGDEELVRHYFTRTDNVKELFRSYIE